jgi:DNA processing protein
VVGAGLELSSREEAEVRAFLTLKKESGLGDRGIKALVERFGSGSRALRARGYQLHLLKAEEEGSCHRGWLAEGIGVLPMTSERYPKVLHQLTDPPPLLFFKGNQDLLSGATVAIVGSRTASEAGRRTAGILAGTLARSGVTVISGMALGIDGAAHRGALEEGGNTAAVLGSGLRVVYPGSHRPLFRKLSSRGLVLSEFLPPEAALPHHFPKRNRIIAALSQAVIVVEAGARSGALITVDHGLDLGREVLAVPGSVQNPRALGSNRLLREGARVITDPTAVVQDLRDLGLSIREAAPTSPRSEPEVLGIPRDLRRLWGVLSATPMGVEEVAKGAAMSFPQALAGLSTLELGGWARQCPGMRFRRR